MAEKIIFKTGLTDVVATDVEGVGVLRKDEFGNIYRWVKNTATTALTARQPTCYEVALTGTQAMFESVLTPATADLMMAAGIAVTAIGASGANMYGWVLAQGKVTGRILIASGTALAVGEELIGVNGTTTLIRHTAAGTAPKMQFTYKSLVVNDGTTGITLTSDVYVNCL